MTEKQILRSIDNEKCMVNNVGESIHPMCHVQSVNQVGIDSLYDYFHEIDDDGHYKFFKTIKIKFPQP